MNEREKRLRQLHKMAAEQLLDDTRLRDALPDELADELLKWGLAQIKRFLPLIDAMTAGEAESWLEEKTTAVAKVMEQINNLVPQLSQLNATAARMNLKTLLETIQSLTGRLVEDKELNWITFDIEKWDITQAFHQIMSLINDEEELTEEV